MKKDKFIDNRLTELADNIHPPERLLTGALNAMRERGIRSPRLNLRKLFLSALPALATIVIVVIAVYGIMNLSPGEPEPTPTGSPSPTSTYTAPYSLSNLHRTTLSFNQAKAMAPEILTLEYDQMNTSCAIYSDSDEVVVVYFYYQLITESGTEWVTVYADLEGALSNYRNYRSYAPDDEVENVRVYEAYINGEYNSYAYFTVGGVDYYLQIVSPDSDRTAVFYYDFINSAVQTD
jgi:hypothetical protein